MSEPDVEPLTADELTVLAIGCIDDYQGPHFIMPRGDMVFVKARHLVWMARRIKALEQYEPKLPAPVPIPDPVGRFVFPEGGGMILCARCGGGVHSRDSDGLNLFCPQCDCTMGHG